MKIGFSTFIFVFFSFVNFLHVEQFNEKSELFRGCLRLTKELNSPKLRKNRLF